MVSYLALRIFCSLFLHSPPGSTGDAVAAIDTCAAIIAFSSDQETPHPLLSHHRPCLLRHLRRQEGSADPHPLLLLS